MPPQLQPFLDWANGPSGYAFPGCPFNGVLVNWYENGLHYIGPHSDDERQLAPGAPILSLSLGATRTLRVTYRAGGRKKCVGVEVPRRCCGAAGVPVCCTPHPSLAHAAAPLMRCVPLPHNACSNPCAPSLPCLPARLDLDMPHGSVVVMGGSMQKEFKHEVPKVRWRAAG